MTSIDYTSLKHIKTVKTSTNQQLEMYKHKLDDTYVGLLRDQRFGPVQYETPKMSKRGDMEQILEGAKTFDIQEELTP